MSADAPGPERLWRPTPVAGTSPYVDQPNPDQLDVFEEPIPDLLPFGWRPVDGARHPEPAIQAMARLVQERHRRPSSQFEPALSSWWYDIHSLLTVPDPHAIVAQNTESLFSGPGPLTDTQLTAVRTAVLPLFHEEAPFAVSERQHLTPQLAYLLTFDARSTEATRSVQRARARSWNSTIYPWFRLGFLERLAAVGGASRAAAVAPDLGLRAPQAWEGVEGLLPEHVYDRVWRRLDALVAEDFAAQEEAERVAEERRAAERLRLYPGSTRFGRKRKPRGG